MGQVKGQRAANTIFGLWQRGFSGFNLREVMASTCIWPWGSSRAVGSQDQSRPAGHWHIWPRMSLYPLLDKHDVISVWACSWPLGVHPLYPGVPAQWDFFFPHQLRSKGKEVIEWLVTLIEAFKRKKRRLNTGAGRWRTVRWWIHKACALIKVQDSYLCYTVVMNC